MRKIKNEKDKVSYIVYCPWRMEVSGGHIALHSLVKNLADSGEIVYNLSKPLYSCNAKTLKNNDFSFDENRTVVIYPEIIEGNPLNAKHVARWILYNTNPAVESTWDETDEYWYYTLQFNTSKKFEKRILSAYNFGTFRNEKEKTKENLLLIRKKTPKVFSHPKDCIEIENPETIEEFVKITSDFKNFYTYDDATFYSLIAAQVGCTSIILNPETSPDEFRKCSTVMKYGVAYGNTEDELKRASDTSHLIKNHLKNLKLESIKQCSEFTKYWRKRLNDL
jgi:hypothetical protein